MSDWAYCPKCATPLPPDAAACPACGATTPSAPTAASGDVPLIPDQDLAALEKQLDQALSPSYILVRRIGAGGMGSVFLARDPALKRLVAVKVLSPALSADPGARARFEREAQAVARLSHPNIVAIHAVGQLEDGTPYFVMQFVGGQSLSARLAEEGPFAPEEARRIVGEVASALAAAHAQGIIHRDIKPANVLYDDESGRVLVSDFGIAAVRPTAERKAETKLTMTGMAVGTPQYMSPEQLLAEAVTEKTDVYALGLLGYELLAGAGPFQATSPQELIAAHLRDTPRPLAQIRDDVDPELESTVTACLAKSPEARPAAQDVAKRFLMGGDRLLEWPPPGLGDLHGRLRTVSRLLGGGALLTVGAFVALLWGGPALSSPGTTFPTLFTFLVGAAGAGTVLVGGWKVIRIGTAATRAVRNGFGFLTVTETLVDVRGDTGALISGAREYAALTPTQRDRLRRGRLWAGGFRALAAALPVAAIVPFVWLLSAGALDPGSAPAVLLGPSVLLLLMARVVTGRERKVVGTVRRRLDRHRAARERLPDLVRTWRESFDGARRDQPLASGPSRRPWIGIAAGVAGTAALVLLLVALLPLAFVGIAGPSIWGGGPAFSSVVDRARVAEAARPFTIPRDPSITPLEAGRALYALYQLGGDATGSPLFAQHPAPPALSDWTGIPLPAGAFADSVSAFGEGPADARPSESGSTTWTGPASGWVLEYAWNGLDDEEMRYLEQVAGLDLWDAVRTVAAAEAVDYLGARFQIPFSDRAELWGLPLPRFVGIKSVAYANTGRAAFFLARGDLDEAERALREAVSLGFALIDNATTLIEALIGVVIVGIARDGLERFYRLTNRPEATTLRARYDSATTITDVLSNARAESGAGEDAPRRRDQIATARDSTALRAMRWEMLFWLAIVPCTNVDELLRGPREGVAAAFADARRRFARFESERAYLDMLLRAPEVTLDVYVIGIGDSPALWAGQKLGRLSAWLLGNPRIATCTIWAAGTL